jgi:hypothetical protein
MTDTYDPGRILALNRIQPGWRIWSRTRHHAGGDADLPDPLGGIVVDIGQRTAVNMETGEIETRTTYTVLDWRHDWQTLTPDEIDLQTLEAPNRSSIAAACRFLVAQAFRAGGRRRGTLTDREIEYLTRAHTLMVAAL